MAAASRLQIAKADIVAIFNDADRKIYKRSDIAAVLTSQRSFWRLAQRTTLHDFIDFLTSKTSLKKIVLKATHHSEEVVRYVWGDVSDYTLALSLRRGAYLTHGSAVFLHGLTDLIPKTIYVNHEQSPKSSGGQLSQRGIDLAFSRKQRTSRLLFDLNDNQILIINGKNTGRLAVESTIGPSGEQLDVTSIERTIIDIVVRPAYAGGVVHVLDAYRAAKDRVSANRLKATLKKLGYVYPYHQAIGFLMERAGYEESRYRLLLQLRADFDFYLTHGMREPQYDEKWRLFFPKGL